MMEIRVPTTVASVAWSANIIAEFLALQQVDADQSLREILDPLVTHGPPETPQSQEIVVVVLCASAILSIPETVFAALKRHIDSLEQHDHNLEGSCVRKHTQAVLVLCGGVGHSTQYLYDAIRSHSQYHTFADRVCQKPEAQVLATIAECFFSIHVSNSESINQFHAQKADLLVLVEDASTNCGENASMTRKLLESHGIHQPRSIVICQDPTMCQRTVATFERVYAGNTPVLYSWPVLVPILTTKTSKVCDQKPGQLLDDLAYDVTKMNIDDATGLWEIPRLLELLLGEIPRLRDDAHGYGPNGRDFISHVDIPEDVEKAWSVLLSALEERNSSIDIMGRAQLSESYEHTITPQ